jgi:hypothetical protein
VFWQHPQRRPQRKCDLSVVPCILHWSKKFTAGVKTPAALIKNSGKRFFFVRDFFQNASCVMCFHTASCFIGSQLRSKAAETHLLDQPHISSAQLLPYHSAIRSRAATLASTTATTNG